MAEFRITGVPAARVAERTKAYERDGATVRPEPEAAGTFTLIVSYPDLPE
jgi:hypothetical protein